MDEPAAACPRCGSYDHDPLRETEHVVTLRCMECHHVHSTSPPRQSDVDLSLIVSEGEESRRETICVATSERVRDGDEFDHDGHRLLVTGLEDERGVRVREARAAELKTIYAKVFDAVPVKITLNIGPVTHSLEAPRKPEDKVHIGEVIEADGRRVLVKTLKSDRNRTIRKGFLLARSVRRAFCDPAPEKAQEGEILPVRQPRPWESRTAGLRARGPGSVRAKRQGLRRRR